MQSRQAQFMFLNAGHFLVHYFMLVFATVAALRLSSEWGLSYAQLIPYSVPGLIAYGVCALPAGWLADRWSRAGMMVIFFIGIGVSSVISSFAETPFGISVGLTLIGIFAAIYHPVGLAMVVQGRQKTGVPVAVNGVFGNMGVASAALITGLLIEYADWNSAFYLPGMVSIVIGLVYLQFERKQGGESPPDGRVERQNPASIDIPKQLLNRLLLIIILTTAFGGLIFQSTTFALPKILDERLEGFADTPSLVGFYTFLVFAIAAFAQLVVGYLLDSYPVRRIFAWITILQCLMFTSMMNLSGLSALIGAIVFMLLVFGEIPIMDVLIGRVVKSEWRSRAYALNYLVNFSVSAAAVPLIAGIHSAWGFDRLFALLAVFALMMFVVVLFLPKECEQRSPHITGDS